MQSVSLSDRIRVSKICYPFAAPLYISAGSVPFTFNHLTGIPSTSDLFAPVRFVKSGFLRPIERGGCFCMSSTAYKLFKGGSDSVGATSGSSEPSIQLDSLSFRV